LGRTAVREGFDTTTRRKAGDGQGSAGSFFTHYRPQVVVCLAVVALLVGGAFYASRISESAPKVVYSASLDEVAAASQQPLKVNINTADAEKLDELPEVGPSTAESIIEYRRANGLFSSVDELEEVPGIGPTTLEQIKPFATV
jgi:competence protein ComEA